MRQFLITVGGVFVGMLLCAIIVPLTLIGIIGSYLEPEKPSLPSDIVLELDLTSPIAERPAQGLAALDPHQPVSVLDLVRGLNAAAGDDRVKGVLIRVGNGVVTPAQAEELHEALKPVREAGKFVLAWAVSFNATTLGDYAAAATADEIWLQPSGIFMSSGFALQSPFFKDLFDKIGAKGDFIALHEYKTAADMFMRNDYSSADREQLTRLLSSLEGTTLQRVADSRKIPVPSLKAALERSPQNAKAAKSGGLVDRLAYDDELRDEIRERAGEDAGFVSLPLYASGLQKSGDANIAIVFAEGMIVEGETEDASLFGSRNMTGGDTLSEAFREAAKDDKIKAIVFRINSPGGSATASDQVWRAVSHARAAGKPVIVSLGDIAASGGYYMAVAGDYLLADKATITGSIGVVGGKIVVEDLLSKIGVHIGSMAENENALMWQPTQPFTPEQRARLNEMLNDTYQDFTSRVAQGRKMTAAQVDSVARGRVWSGVDAMSRNLIDQHGGLHSAIWFAREKANIETDVPLKVKIYPDTPSFFEQLFRSADDVDDVRATIRLLSGLEATPLGRMISEVPAARSPAHAERMLHAPGLELK